MVIQSKSWLSSGRLIIDIVMLSTSINKIWFRDKMTTLGISLPYSTGNSRYVGRGGGVEKMKSTLLHKMYFKVLFINYVERKLLKNHVLL